MMTDQTYKDVEVLPNHNSRPGAAGLTSLLLLAFATRRRSKAPLRAAE